MCGIFGFFLNRPLKNKDIELGLKSLNKQHHRGPDNTGYWYDENEGIFIGHNRLSIIDISDSANQPMVEKNSIISFNGEVYNYLDIKRKYFSVNEKFNTSSDTEVLLKFWKKKKGKSLDELDGMFAFALYENKKLNLVVDHFGEKPLYYIELKEGIYFASEVDALLPYHLNNFDENKYAEFLIFGYINSPNTIYHKVKKIPPSTHLSFTRNNRGFKKFQNKYWVKPKRNYFSSKRSIISKSDISKLKELIIQSIESRLISDVPVGLFLSSGVDSSLIAAILKRELNLDIKCYTVKFDDKLVHDESDLASIIAKNLNLEHEVLHNKKIIEYNITNLKSLYSNDINDNPTIFSYYEMCSLANKEIKVALTGLGGDEMFLGYNRYKFFNKYLRMILMLKKINHFSKIPLNIFSSLNKKLKVVNENFLKHNINQYYLRYKNLNQKNSLFENYFQSDKEFKGIINSKDSFFNFILNFDLEKTLPNSYIPASEMGGMKASLEVRSPFLNKKIYEYLANNFNQSDILNLDQKGILKQILKTYLPNKINFNQKKGFIFPIQQLTKTNKKSYISNRVLLRKKILK